MERAQAPPPGGIRGMNESGSEAMDLDDGQRSCSRRSSSVHGGFHDRSYKEMLEVLKQLSRCSDSVTEQMCELNLKYAELTAKSAMLIDPDVARIVLGDEENYPEVLTSSQMNGKLPREKMEEKYDEMSRALPQREKEKHFNEKC